MCWELSDWYDEVKYFNSSMSGIRLLVKTVKNFASLWKNWKMNRQWITLWIKYVLVVFEQHISRFAAKTNHERNWDYCIGENKIYYLYSIDTWRWDNSILLLVNHTISISCVDWVLLSFSVINLYGICQPFIAMFALFFSNYLYSHLLGHLKFSKCQKFLFAWENK